MSIFQIVAQFIAKVGPRIAKWVGPEVVKYLGKAQNRKRVAESLTGLSSMQPSERFRGRIQATILVLEGITEANDETAKDAFAREAIGRAQRLLTRLDLPRGSRAERRANTKAVAESFDTLLADIDSHLRDER